MTEKEWLTCADPAPMIEFIRHTASDRKLRLFACAVCRRMGHRIENAGTEALAVAEHFADGKADECDLVIADEVLESKLGPITGHRDLLGGLIQTLPGICLLLRLAEARGLLFLARFSEQFGGTSLCR